MQTELMLRLLKCDEASPSGYRIVGYMDINKHGIGIRNNLHSEAIEYCDVAWEDYREIFFNVPTQDSAFPSAVELGVKVNEEWWFEGDLFEYKTTPIGSHVWEVRYGQYHCGYSMTEGLGFYVAAVEDPRVIEVFPLPKPERVKGIGNIHEEGLGRQCEYCGNRYTEPVVAGKTTHYYACPHCGEAKDG